MHTPVLLNEAVRGLNIKKGGKYIDATIGEGGHTEAILKLGGKVLGIDQDENQVKNNEERIKNKDLILINDNFANIEEIAGRNDFVPVDGILFDLGLSMKQLNESGRGLSFKKPEEPLDMRLNPQLEDTAADIINLVNENGLYELIAGYSEDVDSRLLAQTIIEARQMNRLDTVGDLIGALEKKGLNKIKTVARLFQALRIAVNHEKNNLRKALAGSLKIMDKNGRLVVISFHSLEDRWVKRFITDRHLKQINKKVITDDRHSFARSAKVRIISF